jgi:hypothetical protein
MSWQADGWAPAIDSVNLTETTLHRLLAMLVALNLDYLADVGAENIPPLYESHVRYIPDLYARERWATIPHIWSRGSADCKSLCAWRVAELIARGENASCAVSRTPSRSGARVFHILVQRENGSLEDPSYRLGMGWHEGYCMLKRA